MVRIALTGGIATGKSHVARRLRDAGVPVIDADVVSRQVVAPGTAGLAAIVARFGREMLTADGQLDRQRLGSVVFRDAAARADLEAIVHPAVRRSIESFFDALPPETPLAVAEIPLLYETQGESRFARVIVVACAPEAQLARVMARDGLSREDAQRRIAAQMPIEQKVARADDVVRTDGSKAETDAQVDRLLVRLRSRRD
jgi:dephospho-CoA kinase